MLTGTVGQEEEEEVYRAVCGQRLGYRRGGIRATGTIDHRKSTLAKDSRWDYTPLPF